MGSKGPSGSTTSTVQNQNPLANAQLPYMQNLWGAASNLQGDPSQISGQALYNLQNTAQNQGVNTSGLTYNLMPTAMQQYMNQLQTGIPAANQAAWLSGNAANAANTGAGFSQDIAGAAGTALNQVPGWQNQFLGAGQQANQALQGYGSGAINSLTGLAPGALSGLSGLSGQAATAANPAEAGLGATAGAALYNPAYSSALGNLASGAYINPSTNPAYAGMIRAATQPLVNQYETAVAPQVASQFEGAGRYGSGAQTNAQGQAQYGLGQALSNAVANITNNAYNTGLGTTLGAGQALGGLYNTGISNMTGALSNLGQLAQAGDVNAANILNQGYGTAGNLLNQGYTTGGNLATQGYNALNQFMQGAGTTGLGYLNAGLTGLGNAAQAAQAGYGTANTGLAGAGNLLNQGSFALSNELGQAPTFANYPEQQFQAAYNAPWLPLNNLSGILGGGIQGTSTQQTSQPYYSNTAGNVLGGLSGAVGLAALLGF